jgi:deoxycytidine triphosphate deaminase
VRKNSVGRFIDMADEQEDLDRVLCRAYPEEVIDKGYIMQPHEMILCSSDEAFRLPRDVYAMVASKFSYTQLGLSIELSPSIVQSGHNGRIHFQIKNNTENIICIYPHIQVAQLLFFRTVQPSTKVYNEENNHSYDRADVSPISKFRDGNEQLEYAKKPKAGFLKVLLTAVEEKVLESLVGILILFILCLFCADKLNTVLQTYVIPFVKSLNLEISMYVVLFAVSCCLANSIVYIIGNGVLRLLRLAVGFVKRRGREKNEG